MSDQKTSIFSEHARLTDELSTALSLIDDAETALTAAENTYSAAQHDLRLREGHQERDADGPKRVETARRALREAGGLVVQCETSLSARRAQRDAIRRALSELAGGTVEDVVQARQQARTAQEAVNTLAALIAEKEATIPPGDDLSDIEQERSKALAAITLGEDPRAPAEVEKIYQERMKTRQRVVDERARIESLLSGLRDRLPAAQDAAARAEAGYRVVLGAYVKRQRQAAAERYAKAAKKLFQEFGEVIGCTVALGRIGQESDVLRSLWDSRRLEIRPAHADQVDGFQDDGEFREAAEQSVIDALAAHGLTLIP